MKLTKKDKELLRSMGYVDWDLQQIEAASKYTSYRIAGTDKTFSEEKALVQRIINNCYIKPMPLPLH